MIDSESMSNDLEIQLTADGHVAASEEKGREDIIIQVSLCLADQIWWPFNLLVWNPLPTAVIFVILNSSFVVTSYMLYWLNSILTSPGLFALFCLTLYLLLWIISFSLSYPGQLGFVIRDIESNFGQMMKRRLMFCSETIRELLDLVTHDSVQSSSLRIEYLHAYPEFQHSRQHILQPFYQALHWLNDQSPLEYPLNENTKTSTRIMEQLENELMNLDPFLNELHHAAAVSASCFEMKWKELFSLSDQRSTTTIYLAIQNIKSQLDAMEQQVIPFLVHGEQHMQPTREKWPNKLAKVWKRYFQKKQSDTGAIANLSLIRADLCVRYNGRQVWVKNKGHKIDCVFIPAKNQSCDLMANHSRTVILCNPNSGLYECSHLQSDWIEYYTEFDCNVFLFNYRGYGRNSGRPSPDLNNSDGLAIVKYLSHIRGISSLAVHGESIGGLVATYLACQCPDLIQVLVADRTFATLPAVAEQMFGYWISRIFFHVTRWPTDNVSQYLAATRCQIKICCCDPEDEIIANLSSLKAGIAQELIFPSLKHHRARKITKSTNSTTNMDADAAVGFTTEIVPEFIYPQAGQDFTIQMLESLYEVLVQVLFLSKGGNDRLSQEYVQIWRSISALDGNAGQTLAECCCGTDEEINFEQLRLFISCCLVWGHQSSSTGGRAEKNISRCDKPTASKTLVSIDEIQSKLSQNQQLQHGAYLIRFCSYLKETLATPEKKSSPFDNNYSVSCEKQGILLPLKCGHNKAYSEIEKRTLRQHLNPWLLSTSSPPSSMGKTQKHDDPVTIHIH